ncbi:hypothetical protein PRUPE_8G015800 [Prunus persica]|uniref:RING-type domain-containing protein n=1 Tax=Prunus persica TaxID=3760 RepID=A0A251MR72_PRUPE|nr:hypothetical protein PRUPE_8G015100 [Prunus persica]ONH89778.1 hypothetical protein PRUPE_8G015800 [Prunus persica]
MDELDRIEISTKEVIESKFGSDVENHLGMLCSLIPEFIHEEKFGVDSVMLITPFGDSERMLEERHGHTIASSLSSLLYYMIHLILMNKCCYMSCRIQKGNMGKRLISTKIKDMHIWIAKLGRSEMSTDELKRDIIFGDLYADDRSAFVQQLELLVFLVPQWILKDPEENPNNFSICRKNTKDAKIKLYQEIDERTLGESPSFNLSKDDFLLNLRRSIVKDFGECSTCWDDLYNDEGLSVDTLPCGHAFHCKCVREWCVESGRNTTCPLCRGPIIPRTINMA